MKPLTILLGIVAVLLLFIMGKLFQVQALLESSSQNTQSVVISNQALIASNQKLGEQL